MSGCRIRPATRADANAIARVHVQTWRETYRGLVPNSMLLSLSEDHNAHMWADIIERNADKEAVFVAEGDTIVGFGSAGPARSKGIGTSGEIYWIYLLDGVKRQGIGRTLFGELVRELIARGHVSVGLWVLIENNPARRFYEAVGGRTGPTRDTNHEGHVVNEIAYTWNDLSRLSGR